MQLWLQKIKREIQRDVCRSENSLDIKRNSCNVSPWNGDHPWILPTYHSTQTLR